MIFPGMPSATCEGVRSPCDSCFGRRVAEESEDPPLFLYFSLAAITSCCGHLRLVLLTSSVPGSAPTGKTPLPSPQNQCVSGGQSS
uniref:Uncharacterized protein n=1 Tax=Anguilla anguilla TaxID=7936 RepID=A0A0E9W9C7_ANGAN